MLEYCSYIHVIPQVFCILGDVPAVSATKASAVQQYHLQVRPTVLTVGEATAASIKGSSPLRWLPLALLAIYAALDCLVQYTLAATDATSVLHIPPGIVNFIRVGLQLHSSCTLSCWVHSHISATHTPWSCQLHQGKAVSPLFMRAFLLSQFTGLLHAKNFMITTCVWLVSAQPVEVGILGDRCAFASQI